MTDKDVTMRGRRGGILFLTAMAILGLAPGAPRAQGQAAQQNETPTTATAQEAPAPLTETQKIERLLEFVSHSGLTFVRNGDEYPAEKAADHLRMKWNRTRKRIKTARQFIDYLASKSSISGEPYFVIRPDGTRIPSHDWLLAELAVIENKPAPTPQP